MTLLFRKGFSLLRLISKSCVSTSHVSRLAHGPLWTHPYQPTLLKKKHPPLFAHKLMNNFAAIPPLDAAAVLKRFHIRADKSLGQNFLQDTSALENIALAAEIQEDDCVLGIGP